jgi:hypothetical protein
MVLVLDESLLVRALSTEQHQKRKSEVAITVTLRHIYGLSAAFNLTMMQETEEPCPYPRASLSARNLLRSPFQQQPIASNVQKFVADQQRYLRRHAKDGVATAEEWGRVAQGESLETQNTTMRRALPPSQRAILLSSPILTALVPEAQPIRNTIIRLPNRKHSLPHSTLISAYTAYPAPGSQNIAVRLTSKRKECPDLQNVAGHPPLHEDELRVSLSPSLISQIVVA